MNSLHISDKDAMHPEKQYMDFFTQHEDVLHRYAPAFMNALRTIVIPMLPRCLRLTMG